MTGAGPLVLEKDGVDEHEAAGGSPRPHIENRKTLESAAGASADVDAAVAKLVSRLGARAGRRASRHGERAGDESDEGDGATKHGVPLKCES